MEEQLLALSRELLDAISTRDWDKYEALCDPALTSFEPEACGQLVEGLPFHKFYFEATSHGRTQNTMCSPRVRMLGDDAGVVAYTRVVQTEEGERAYEETRVWQKQDGKWRHVHFHRS